jgi:hypothetical protein
VDKHEVDLQLEEVWQPCALTRPAQSRGSSELR